jgi:hypothetical protein
MLELQDQANAQKEARHAALYVAWASLAGNILSLPILHGLKLPYQHELLKGFLVALAVTALGRWKNLSRQVNLAIFALVCLLNQLTIWINHETFVSHDLPSGSFFGHKIYILMVALLAPTRWIGTIFIGSITIEAVVQILSWPPSVRLSISSFEPVATVTLALAALGVLSTRCKHLTLIRTAAHLHAEKTWLERAASLSLSIRDLANTPLQTLTCASSLLRHRAGPAHSNLISRLSLKNLDSALGRLVRLNMLLEPLGRLKPLGQSDLSFNSLEQIEKTLSIQAEFIQPLTSLKIADPIQEAREALLWFSWYGAGFSLINLAHIARYEWTEQPIFRVWLAFAAFSLVIAGLAQGLKRLPRAASLILFGIEGGVFIAVCWLTTKTIGLNDFTAPNGLKVVTFDSLKLLALVLAVLAPSSLLGGTLIGMTAVAALAQTFLWSPEARERVTFLEPWMTCVLATILLAVFLLQKHQLEYVKKIASEQAQYPWFERLARLSLMVRELSKPDVLVLKNTTAQISEELSEESPTQIAMLKVMNGAVGKLERLNQALEPLKQTIPQQTEESKSVPDLTAIAREVDQLISFRLAA